MDSNKKVDFGYKTVAAEDKASLVANVFDSVASKYDLMNDLMSLGIHRLWKRFAIELTAARTGQKILDIAGGTGDLSWKFSQIVGETGEVVLADINGPMLSVGRDRLINRGGHNNLRYVQTNAEQLAFPDNYFDCVTIAFGLRNVTDKDAALQSMLRVLKPGGRCLILEFSKPNHKLLSEIYDQYSFKVLPKIGGIVTKDEDSYRYLAESIRMHPNQQTLKSMMEDAGFTNCEYFNMTGGIVAAHRGIKN